MKLIDHRRLQLTLVIFSAALFLLSFNANPFAQSRSQFPTPTAHVDDVAGVLDEQTKERLENVLENLRQRFRIDFYVVLVDTTGGRDIFDFSRQLAHDWNIGARTTVKKSLLMVVSVNDKSAFTQFSRSVQGELPDSVLGEMSQRMRGPIAEGRFSDAVNSGVDHFVGALAKKAGFKSDDIQQPSAIASTVKREPAPAKDTTDNPAPTPDVAAVSKPSTTKGGKPVARSSREMKSAGRNLSSVQDDEAEAEEVELTLTLPFEPRVAKLKQFLETHPDSKIRPHAIELLISAYAALGDQKLRSGDTSGGIESLLLAIDQAPEDISDKLFSGVISQIPLNLYLRGERPAAFKAAQNIETRFGNDPKHLLAIAGFYLRVEQGEEAARVAALAVKLAPEMAEAHHALGLGLHISLRLDEAMLEYKRTLELDPESKGTRRSLADLNRATGKPQEALALYRQQLIADPTDKAARAGVVLSLFELDKTDEANAELEAVLKDDPKNLSLLTGAAYWLAAHGDAEKGLELARRAVEIEPRYTWAQISAARAFVSRKQPLEAERALRFARLYGKFPTLDYELATVLAAAGLYDESVEALGQSFALKGGQVETRLAGQRLAQAPDFLELLAPERRASIFQYEAADTASNARMLKALLTFNAALSEPAGKVDEAAATEAAKDFAAGDDEMRTYRQLYAATRLLRAGVGLPTVYELAEAAKTGVDAALEIPAVTVAVQADEFRDIRARALASGGTPYIPDAPRIVLANILRGRIEDLTGWALFNQDKTAEAIERLKRAALMLPEATPSWRAALWHLGVALEQADHKDEALNYYIKSYASGDPDPVRRQLIEQLYRKVNGSLDGLDLRLSASTGSASVPAASPEASVSDSENNQKTAATERLAGSTSIDPSASQPAGSPLPNASPEVVATPSLEKTPAESATPTVTPTTSSTPEAQPSPEATPTPVAQPTPTEEQAIAQAAARLRATIKITGRVKDTNNKGIPNVVVVLISPRGTVLASTTDAEGNYSFNVSPSQHDYRLVPSKEGYRFEPIDMALTAFSEDLKEIDFVGTSRSP